MFNVVLFRIRASLNVNVAARRFPDTFNPLSGAVESTATTLPEIIQEMLLCKTSERQGRMIDRDKESSMEKKKKEGYF